MSARIPSRPRAGPTSPPAWIKPQLAKLVEKAPDGPEWAHEMKLGGYKTVADRALGEITSPLTMSRPIQSDLSKFGYAFCLSIGTFCTHQGEASMKYPASVIRTNQCIWYHATGPEGLGIHNFNPDVGAPARAKRSVTSQIWSLRLHHSLITTRPGSPLP